MLNNMETIVKMLKWTIICDISQLYSQALHDELHTTDAIGRWTRLENKVAIKVMDNDTKSREEIIQKMTSSLRSTNKC